MSVASNVTEKAFVDRRTRDWEELDALTRKAHATRLRKLSSHEVARLPPLYRNVCADLAASQVARYSAPLVDYLRGLTASAHTLLYAPAGLSVRSTPQGMWRALRRGWFVSFPRAVRARWRSMTLAAGLFFIPLAIGAWLTLRDPAFAFRVTPEAMLRQLTEAYTHGFDAGRGAGESVMMAGFYINNNVGIALRCFALGVFGGLGSAFYLVQNGITIGATLGYVTSQGAGMNILTFIVGHSSLELGAIVLAGGSGLSLGWSVVSPGDRTRLASLQKRAREIIVIVFGAAAMLLMAAGIEGFWSASSAPRTVKFAVGTVLFVLVALYVTLAGRRSDDNGEGAR
ncbi:MAG: stage II sporulation protein M [Polyangiaceae bacterium]|nr:stage II sporulation protein M [Polyangiaceae bacterium]